MPGEAPVHVAAIEEVVMDDWATDRVVITGDAAQATSPNMARGAAMALEAALVLSECFEEPAPRNRGPSRRRGGSRTRHLLTRPAHI